MATIRTKSSSGTRPSHRAITSAYSSSGTRRSHRAITSAYVEILLILGIPAIPIACVAGLLILASTVIPDPNACSAASPLQWEMPAPGLAGAGIRGIGGGYSAEGDGDGVGLLFA